MKKALCWIRRDLRLHDHAALARALSFGETTLVFVFDTHILSKLSDEDDRRITFIMDSLKEIERELLKHGSSLIVLYGKPEEEIPKLAVHLKVSAVFTNRDYGPYEKKRDEKVASKLKSKEIDFLTFKDSVFFEGLEIQKNSGGPYQVFTPYKNRWLQLFEEQDQLVPHFKCVLRNLRQFQNKDNVLDNNFYSLIGFLENKPIIKAGSKEGHRRLKKFLDQMEDYKEARNFPAVAGTSSLSTYLRFGNISVREMVNASLQSRSAGAKSWLSEIIWRDFYQMILDQFPYVENSSFKPEYDRIRFVGKDEDFRLWCEGKTGFPIVDAAMRCLNETGLMHNRLRMITASFLCKILLVDWKKGEAYFAGKLLDFDLASNNGGWQWSSSSGADAQPYFRIFNPYLQSEKFDPDGEFIRRWCPELKDLRNKDIHRPPLLPNYPAPIVSYEKNRERALVMYAVVKNRRN
jgi:deoxyribodipyrimidine photo-lyase